MAEKKLELTKKINSPAKEVFLAFTNATIMQQWLGNYVTVAPQPKGRFYSWWDDGYYASGIFKTVKENKSLSFTWQGKGEAVASLVEIDLNEAEDSTEISLVHSGFDESMTQETVDSYKRDWINVLENLQWTLEKGVDKRVFERPFLGVLIAGFLDEDQAEKRGLPVPYGVHLAEIMPDSGAKKSGLQADDVITKFAGVEIKEFSHLTAAVSKFKAGDKAPVEVYRGTEKLEIEMLLSQRPMPEGPDTAKELAEEARKIHKTLDAELEALFEGASEEEARKRPEENEWCAKETVAHLLYTERWHHLNMSIQAEGGRFPGFTNDLGSIAALASSAETVADLLSELKYAEKVTASMIDNLSDEHVARKVIFIPLLNWIMQGVANHSRSHFPQIQEAIAASRED